MFVVMVVPTISDECNLAEGSGIKTSLLFNAKNVIHIYIYIGLAKMWIIFDMK